MDAPVAPRKPHELTVHGHTRVDEYFWLREREDPGVISHLEAENAYTETTLAHTRPLQDRLYEEIKGRIKEDDSSVPYHYGGWWYYTRYEEGQQYPVYCRREGSLEAPEQVMLDVNEMAQGHAFYEVGGASIRPDHQLLAFAVDTQGRRKYTIRFKDLRSGELLPEALPLTTGSMAWASDGEHLFYNRMDEQTLRSHQVWRHRLGTDPGEDMLVYEEPDETFNCYVGLSKSREYLFIASWHTLRSEVRYLRADDPTGEFAVIAPRGGEHEYSVDHVGDHFWIVTNDTAKNFRLVKAPVDTPGREHWQEVVPGREETLLEGVELFDEHLVLEERHLGLMRFRVRTHDGGEEHLVEFDDPAYDASGSVNVEPGATSFRYAYSSLTTPATVFEHDLRSRERTQLKQQPVLGPFDPAWYESARLMVEARDGAKVPVSLVWRRDLRDREHGNPLMLYGYGSYGMSMGATFSSARLSLLDRGFVYAIAHIRGSSTLGRAWYDDGKKLKKWNTFHDFIDVARHLQAGGWTTPEQTYCSGGSAGGLLVGAVINEAPGLFHGAYTRVPFVDVVTTMLDDSIPLTTGEYDEWGDPNNPEYYRYMLSYSPYDNVKAQDYPHLLVTTGLHDSQVQYWEPAKWVARLRERKTDDNLLLLQTNMHAGHGGASGRYEQWRETAFHYAFIIDLANAWEAQPWS